MRRFAHLYAALDATTSTSTKVAAMAEYFRAVPAADAAWALYFLSGGKPRQIVPAKTLAALACRLSRIPDWLFDECYLAVGDLAETITRLLPSPGAGSDEPLAHWVEARLFALRTLQGEALEQAIRDAWDELDTDGRFVFTKLITGSFRVGVSRLLVTRAVGQVAGLDAKLVAERMAGVWTPSEASFRALVAPAGTPQQKGEEGVGQPYPFYLAHQLTGQPDALGPIDAWRAEWKWDGIRAQLLVRAGRVYLWSRGEELMTDRFPEIADVARTLPSGTTLDGEILAWRGDDVLPFAVLQRRITRKTVGPKLMADAPAAFMTYDLLSEAGVDLRAQPFDERRRRLEALVAAHPHSVLRISPLVTASDWAALGALRTTSRARRVEGLMLKHGESRYLAGRVKGDRPSDAWWKWKIDPYSIDAVLVYAQRGHGRRASLYTDYTFAVWDAGALVPFAKAYSGLTDEEFREVDRFIQKNTLEKFGPVRSVTPALVFEIGFEGIARSPRHKSGIAVRFPRMLRRRTDKTPDQADELATLRALIEA